MDVEALQGVDIEALKNQCNEQMKIKLHLDGKLQENEAKLHALKTLYLKKRKEKYKSQAHETAQELASTNKQLAVWEGEFHLFCTTH